jgi:phosphatidate phosphatase LPIN
MRPPTDSEFLFDNDPHTPNISKPNSPHGMKIDSQPPSSPSGMQEYSWEWGAFPTPSPVKAVFGKGGRFESWKNNVSEDKDMLAGAYVTISAKNEDDTTLFLTINRKSLDFQLSLIPGPQLYSGESRREEGTIDLSQIPNADEFARRFEEGKITFSRFMGDDIICRNPTLVVKWVDGHFVSLCDNPLLFEALASWRTNTLNSRSKKGLISENAELTDATRHSKSKSEPPTPEQKAAAEAEELGDGADKKPGSLSWVQWLSRNRPRNTVDVMPVTPMERPLLRPAATEPPAVCLPSSVFSIW